MLLKYRDYAMALLFVPRAIRETFFSLFLSGIASRRGYATVRVVRVEKNANFKRKETEKLVGTLN